jgi:hypothetical protein
MSFTAWDSVVWPKLMNTMESGMFRVREYKTLLEWTFTPQWRTNGAIGDWQNFNELTPCRGAGVRVICFSTKEEAEEFIDGALVNQPVLELHDYQPAQQSDWRPLQ